MFINFLVKSSLVYYPYIVEEGYRGPFVNYNFMCKFCLYLY